MLYLRGPKRRCCQCLVVGSGRDDHSSIRVQERFQETAYPRSSNFTERCHIHSYTYIWLFDVYIYLIYTYIWYNKNICMVRYTKSHQWRNISVVLHICPSRRCQPSLYCILGPHSNVRCEMLQEPPMVDSLFCFLTMVSTINCFLQSIDLDIW